MNMAKEDVISSARIVFADNENLDEKIELINQKVEELIKKVSDLTAVKTEVEENGEIQTV